MEKNIKATQINEESTNLEAVKNTPFTLVIKENNVQIVCGEYLVTRKVFKNKEEAIKYVNCKPWELIINAACIAFNHLTKLQNETEQNKTEKN